MRIALPDELLHFSEVQRMKEEISQKLPGVHWIHHAGEAVDKAEKLMLSEGDACFPFKKMVRTSFNLLARSDVLLLPRIIKVKGYLSCPNFRALPDIVDLNRKFYPEHQDLAVLVSPLLQENKKGRQRPSGAKQALNSLRSICSQKKWQALAAGAKKYKAGKSRSGKKIKEELPDRDWNKTIALIGRPYILDDPSINLGIPGMLKQMGYSTFTSGQLPFNILNKLAAERDYYAKVLYWHSGRETLGAYLYFARQACPAGIIHILSFNCGVEALSRIELESLHKEIGGGIPFMVQVLDEHTQREHISTRLEAFLDIIHAKSSTSSNNRY